MSALQLTALAFTVLAPLAVWVFDRRVRSPRALRIAERLLAAALLLAETGALAWKMIEEDFALADTLPMHLCDWALLLICAALWWHWRTGFEIAYFWGLAGTFQALFTPAIPADLHWLRAAGFFFIHAGIVAAVFHLLLSQRWRPTLGSLARAVAASEGYLAVALLVNHATGGNYGFLSRRPEQPSMLDLFSEEPWLYVVQLNLTALVFFVALYAPWHVADIIARRAASTRRV